MKKEMEHDVILAEKVVMKMQDKINKTDEKLEKAWETQSNFANDERVYPLNKRDRKRVSKIEQNKDLSREEKDKQIAEIRGKSDHAVAVIKR